MTPKALDLPFEITSKIFLECLPAHGRIQRPAPDEPPLLLAQICQQWRSVAIATPGMWTSIALDNSSTDTAYKGLSRLFGDVDPSPSTVSLFFDLWFMRAGTHPLSITINCGEDTDAVAALSVYFPRCGTIELATDFAGINDISGPLPYLRKLNIRVKKFRPTTILAFPNAPKLEELRLSTVSVPFVQLRLGVPSTTLTRLEGSFDSALALCLRAVPNVSVLRIQLYGLPIGRTVDSDPHVLDQPKFFPSFHTLHVQDYRPPSVLPTQAYLLLIQCFRTLSARGVRIHVVSPSFSLPDDLKLEESVVAEVEDDPDNPFHQCILSETSTPASGGIN
ncbi:hypothetical protein C8J57DRAFT_1466339 [Mycena rebaudengoi]|nr:hypothetical protein C8J57DRAFT_1466339 [Mycena rebaudengoi]